VKQQQRIQTFQILASGKADIHSPFALVGRPVVVHVEMPKDLFADRIEHDGNAVECFCPVGRQLLVHQPLCLRIVLNPWKTVVLSYVAQSRRIHLPRQPFASVQANLHAKGKPCLNPRVHEAEHRMHPVLIEVQTFALFQFEIQFLGVPRSAPPGNSYTGSTLFSTNQSTLNLLFGLNLTRNFLFARPPPTARTEVLEHHMAAPQVLLNSSAVGDLQRAQPPHYQSVKVAQNTINLVGKFRDKLLHGVPFLRDTCLETHTSYEDCERLSILVAAPPR
jgi:hypothetical protein